jgi:hypothetical protein
MSNDTFLRCACDQYGRCLMDCPSADRTDRPGPSWYWKYWNVGVGRWVRRP